MAQRARLTPRDGCVPCRAPRRPAGFSRVNMDVRIIPFDSSLTPHFARLNREWIERYFVLEPADLAVLDESPSRARPGRTP